MRNLTIKREDSFVGKLISMKVYIADYENGEKIEIAGRKCRYLGSIKNGETKTFEITNEKCRVFVIADKITKGICNDFYTISAGKGDIAISGKNQLNLFNLNSFIFNGAPTREMARNRQYNKTLGGIIFTCLVVIGIVLGLIFGLANSGKKTFEYDNMKITLTEDFTETDVNGWEFCFTSKDTTIFGRKETVKDYPLLESFSLNEYSKLVLSNTKIDSSVELNKHNDYYYFSYVSNNVGGKGDVMYYAIMFDAPDGFMIINFSCLTEKVEELAPQIFEWADSVKFK